MKHIRRDLVKSVLASFRLPRCLTIAVILSLPSTVLAEEDTGVAPAMRTWSDSSGRFSGQAKPIDVEGETVRFIGATEVRESEPEINPLRIIPMRIIWGLSVE